MNTLGRYQIIREIARSNDIVYEARDPVMGRRVAIKELSIPPSLTGQARRERIDRFFREAKAAGSLSPHPHVVTIYEVGQQGERYFIAMEYLEGQPLREVLQMEGPMPLERVRRLGVQVCDALEYAHGRGVVHRDIKPDNIHVLPGDVVKLTDFGIARIVADPSITADGQVFGTPSYMSPEQVAGKAIDARTDVYSLGITLYEMLAGRKPFTGDTVVTITYNIMNQELPALPGVPPEMLEVIRRATAKSPDQRYRSAGEMRAALQGARAANVTSMGYAGAAVGMPGRPVTPPPHHPTMGPPAPPYGAPSPLHPFTPSPAHPPASSGPEPTDPEIPPLYVPRRPSALIEYARRNRHFLSALGYAIILALACVFFIWAASAAYHNYHGRAKESQAIALVNDGNALFHAKRYADAVDKYRQAIATAGGTETGNTARQSAAAAEISLGNDLLDGQAPQQALEHYTAALEYDSRSALAHFGTAMAYYRLARSDDAVREWSWVVQDGSDSKLAGQARRWLAAVYFDLGQQAEQNRQLSTAVDYYTKCVNVDPNSSYAASAQTARDRIVTGATAP